MSDRVESFSVELEKLVKEGELLAMALDNIFAPRDFREVHLKALDGDEGKLEGLLQDLPCFSTSYQDWYSKALAVIKQVLPDRLDDFVSHYEFPRARKEISYENYMIRDCLQDLRVEKVSGQIVNGSAAIPEFRQQLNMLKAAKASLHSTLMDLKGVLQADLFDSEVETAQGLANAGFLRGAGAICGVVIEKHLLHVCNLHGTTVRKNNPSISDLSQLLKDAGVTTLPQWRFIQHLADIRNLCDHWKGRDPQKDEVEDLISGTAKVLKTVF